MTASAIQVLKSAIEKASPGEWRWREVRPDGDYPPYWSVVDATGRHGITIDFYDKVNLDFIVAARNHLPSLLARLEALEAVVEEARTQNDGGWKLADMIAALDAKPPLDSGKGEA